MDLSYAIMPFFAWLCAGSLKFLINSLKARRLAFDLIGYGGMPSTHSAIVSSMAALVALKEGIQHPAFGIALTLAIIIMVDANGLRRQVGRHAAAINKLGAQTPSHTPLRERMGHSRAEILAGITVGALCAYLVHLVTIG
ncbi:MAG: divergent PAP2 family protein [Pseudomonadota bacterium]